MFTSAPKSWVRMRFFLRKGGNCGMIEKTIHPESRVEK